MRQWSKPIHPDADQVWDFDVPHVDVDVAENPIVAVLLGPDGQPIRMWAEREPIGYRIREAE